MCSIRSDGNGGQRVTFGPREWIGLAAISMTAVGLAAAIMWTLVDLKIEAAIAMHSAAPIHTVK